MLEELYNRIILRLEFKADTFCWEWQGPKLPAGYGTIGVKRKTYYTHRVMYEYFHSPIINGNFVMHLCNNPKCCNPDHLLQGSQKENLAYASSLGRMKKTLVPGVSGLLGVFPRTVEPHKYWKAWDWVTNTTLYHGKDFFEACCARLSFENRQKETNDRT